MPPGYGQDVREWQPSKKLVLTALSRGGSTIDVSLLSLADQSEQDDLHAGNLHDFIFSRSYNSLTTEIIASSSGLLQESNLQYVVNKI